MIFKSFKVKSNQKYVNNLLDARKAAINKRKVTSIGVLLNEQEFRNSDAFNHLFKLLGLNAPKHKILTYSIDESIAHAQWDTFYGPKDFGWNGKIKNLDLQQFVERDFDVLICYYTSEYIELKQIAAMSNANFKVGITSDDERLYDLIINVKPSQFDVFASELKKYLMILNKL